MKRLNEIEIGGKKFPLNFSTKAANEVDEKFGGIEKIEVIFSKNSVAGMMGDLVWILHLLIEQGVAYKKIVEDEEIPIYTLEELEVLVGIADIKQLQTSLLDTMHSGMSAEIEVETEGKNQETTQAN